MNNPSPASHPQSCAATIVPWTPEYPASPPRGYTTNQTATAFGVVPHTLRVALCKRGEYLGIRPVKLANGRLLWPAAEVDAVALGKVA